MLHRLNDADDAGVLGDFDALDGVLEQFFLVNLAMEGPGVS